MQFTIFRSAFHDQAQFLCISFLGFPLTGAENKGTVQAYPRLLTGMSAYENVKFAVFVWELSCPLTRVC